jgi:dolichol kinase
MSIRVNEQLSTLMDEIRTLVAQFEAQPAGTTHAAQLAGRLTTMSQLAEQLSQALQAQKTKNVERIVEALIRLRTFIESNRHSLRNTPDMARLRKPLADRYEHLLDALRTTPRFAALAQTIRTLRPINYWRNIFHACMGISAVVIYEYLTITPGHTIVTLGILLGVYLFLDGVRRMHPTLNHLIYGTLFGLIARPRERYQTPAAIWYVMGLMVAVAIATPTHAQLAALILGVADPAASLIGKRWGKRKLYRDRSWVGTLSFIAVGSIAALVFLCISRDLSFGVMLGTALVAASAGAIGELLSTDRLDDNLLIPCFVASGLSLVYGSLLIF